MMMRKRRWVVSEERRFLAGHVGVGGVDGGVVGGGGAGFDPLFSSRGASVRLSGVAAQIDDSLKLQLS
jgi:hypothetical protein